MKFLDRILVFCFSLAWFSLVQAANDDTTIVAFSRHTFRGVAKEIGPQKIALKEYGIELEIPLLSYTHDATPVGLDIAKKFASRGLQDAAMLAVNSLGKNKKFDNRWDEFRADLATERTFWTAIKVREGLTTGRAPIALTGCKTKVDKAVDVISARDPVMQCIHSSAPNTDLLRLYQERAEKFLIEFRNAMGLEGDIPPLPKLHYVDGKLETPNEYEEAIRLASTIEMAAAISAPLPQILKKVDKVKQGKAVLTAGANMLGLRFFIKNPLPIADNISLHALKYMASRAQGSHTVIFTHDDYISSLLHSLGLISSESPPSDLAIYPLETIVFAFDDKHVAVTRMQLKIRKDGFIPGTFDTSILWKGSREDWNKKIEAINIRSQTWNIEEQEHGCLNTLEICVPETLKVVY